MSQIIIKPEKSYVLYQLNGQFIGGDETEKLRESINENFNSELSNLIINLKDVSFMNSTALGVLISAHSNSIRRGGKMVLCNPSKVMNDLFSVTKLNLVLNIDDTFENAQSKFTDNSEFKLQV